MHMRCAIRQLHKSVMSQTCLGHCDGLALAGVTRVCLSIQSQAVCTILQDTITVMWSVQEHEDGIHCVVSAGAGTCLHGASDTRKRTRSVSAERQSAAPARAPSTAPLSVHTPAQRAAPAVADTASSPQRPLPTASSPQGSSWTSPAAPEDTSNSHNNFVAKKVLQDLTSMAMSHVRFGFSKHCGQAANPSGAAEEGGGADGGATSAAAPAAGAATTAADTGSGAPTSPAATPAAGTAAQAGSTAQRCAPAPGACHNGMHCHCHALSEEDSAECSDCSDQCNDAAHSHDMSCKECNAVLHVFSYAEAMIAALAAGQHASVEEVQQWEAQCADHLDGIRELLAHKLRTRHQELAREQTVRSMSCGSAVITIDFMHKWLLLSRIESQQQRFGKAGTSMHGASAIVKVLPADLQERAAHWHQLSLEQQQQLQADMAARSDSGGSYQVISIATPSCSDHKQDAWLTAAHWEVALQQLKKQVPYLCDIYPQCDNAPNYHCTQFMDQAAGVATACGLRLLEMWFNEPGEGKDLVDGMFNNVKTPVRNRINRSHGNLRADTSVHLAALASMHPPKGVTLVVCQTPARPAAPWAWQTATGCKRWYHIRYLQPDFELPTAPSSKGSEWCAAAGQAAPGAVQSQQRSARAAHRGDAATSGKVRKRAKKGAEQPSQYAAEPQLISRDMLRLQLLHCKVPVLRSFLQAHRAQASGRRDDMHARVLQLHSDCGGRLGHLQLLAPPANSLQGRPIVAYRHYNFGEGEVTRLPLPTVSGQAATGSYGTGAIGVAPADVLPPQDLQQYNEYAQRLKLQPLTSTIHEATARLSKRMPGLRRPEVAQLSALMRVATTLPTTVFWRMQVF